MTKDQIIEKQSEIIRDLLKIGMERYQEIFNLFCTIEKLPKGGETIEPEALPIIDRSKVVEMRQPQKIKSGRICPRCKTNNRQVLKSGRVASYCRECNAARAKGVRKNRTGMSDRDVQAIKAMEASM